MNPDRENVQILFFTEKEVNSKVKIKKKFLHCMKTHPYCENVKKNGF